LATELFLDKLPSATITSSSKNADCKTSTNRTNFKDFAPSDQTVDDFVGFSSKKTKDVQNCIN